jgi:hypothetical protein
MIDPATIVYFQWAGGKAIFYKGKYHLIFFPKNVIRNVIRNITLSILDVLRRFKHKNRGEKLVFVLSVFSSFFSLINLTSFWPKMC